MDFSFDNEISFPLIKLHEGLRFFPVRSLYIKVISASSPAATGSGDIFKLHPAAKRTSTPTPSRKTGSSPTFIFKVPSGLFNSSFSPFILCFITVFDPIFSFASTVLFSSAQSTRIFSSLSEKRNDLSSG